LPNFDSLIKSRLRGFLSLLPLISCTAFSIHTSKVQAKIDDELVSLPYTEFICGNTQQAKRLSNLIVNDKDQIRTSARCNPTLVALAEAKVKDMAERGLVSHFLGGSPNSHIRQAGLTLPHYYGKAMSNQVEALAGGYRTAKQVWHALKTSHSHKQHLLGELPFYAEQDEMGVAFIKDIKTPHVEYWAIYFTKLDSAKHQVTYDKIPDKGLGIVIKDEN